MRLGRQLYRYLLARALSRAALAFFAINRPLICFAGVIVSGIVIVALAAAWEAWQAHSERLAQRSIEYDMCIVLQGGNVAFCDALMRLRERERASKP
jgi:pyrimidine deaminase RibD-like protein